MKDKFKVVAAFLCGAVFFSGVSYAATGDIIAKPVKFKVVVDGQEKKFDNQVLAVNGTTYLSIKDMAKAVDKSVAFNNGVISLDSASNSSTSVPYENNTSVTPKVDSNNEVSSIENFKKLPLTVTKNNITVKVSSVVLTDRSTDFEVTVINDSNEKTTIEYGGVIGINKNVPGKTYSTLSTIRSADNFPDFIDANSTVEGIIRKSKAEPGTENAMFYLTVGRDVFSFYIDTKGDL